MRRLWPTSLARLSPFALLLALSAWSGRAHAGGEAAAAEALFLEAKKLVAEKRYAEACPKFEESNRIDRAAGTLIHLGNCYEKTNRSATAWATYKEAANAAEALGRQDWKRIAAKRASALEGKLARLTIRVTGAADEKIEISRDGTALAPASWGVPIPVDVGTHAIEASAPGRIPFKASVTITRDGEQAELTIPELEPEPAASSAEADRAPGAAPPSAAITPAAEAEGGGGLRTLGFVVGGVGAAGIVAGAVTGLMAMGKSSDAKAVCAADGPCASRQAVDDAESARAFGLVSTLSFAAGGALLAAGAALVIASPANREGSAGRARGARRVTSLRLAPGGGAGSAGLLLRGEF